MTSVFDLVRGPGFGQQVPEDGRQIWACKGTRDARRRSEFSAIRAPPTADSHLFSGQHSGLTRISLFAFGIHRARPQGLGGGRVVCGGWWRMRGGVGGRCPRPPEPASEQRREGRRHEGPDHQGLEEMSEHDGGADFGRNSQVAGEHGAHGEGEHSASSGDYGTGERVHKFRVGRHPGPTAWTSDCSIDGASDGCRAGSPPSGQPD